MKKTILLIVSLLFCISIFGAKEKQNKKVQPKQWFSFAFNGTKWKVASHQETKETITMEWTNSGEPVTNWSELVTAQILFTDTKQINAQRFSTFFINQIKTGSIDFKVKKLLDTPDAVVFEWSHKGSGKWPAQREIVHVFRGKDAIYRLAYTVKEKSYNSFLYRVKYTYWLKTIKQAKLIDQKE
jgi:hypothetical protein